MKLIYKEKEKLPNAMLTWDQLKHNSASEKEQRQFYHNEMMPDLKGQWMGLAVGDESPINETNTT